jgi:FdhD protein
VTTSLSISETLVKRVTSEGRSEEVSDVLAVEEPLEIRVGFSRGERREHKAISITMRTPGEDEALAVGFLFTEGIIESREQIAAVRHCGKPTSGKGIKNTILVELADGVEVDLKRLERHFYTSSSCGVCGKSSIEALHTGARRIESGGPTISPEVIHRLPTIGLANQSTFKKTGGLHASVIFDVHGEIEGIAEDVGRHNALDKVIGAKFLSDELPLEDKILLVSGRASFELVQKALMAGIPVMAAVGAPSSLAVELAREFNLTLVGFVRDGRFNIYTGEWRIRQKHDR